MPKRPIRDSVTAQFQEVESKLHQLRELLVEIGLHQNASGVKDLISDLEQEKSRLQDELKKQQPSLHMGADLHE